MHMQDHAITPSKSRINEKKMLQVWAGTAGAIEDDYHVLAAGPQL